MEQSLFLAFSGIVQQEFGILLPVEKKALLEARMQGLLKDHPEYGDEAGFLRALRDDRTGKKLAELAEAITTHHTFFMREADHFDFFRDTVLPWIASSVRDGDIRMWCAACSTGQESYTLAMLLQDRFGLQENAWEKTLLATDLSRDVLDFARAGVYPTSALEDLPESWLRGYFRPKDATHRQVIDHIRDQVLYRQFNLMEPHFPFRKPFHTIFCRNVMIYFDAPTRNRLVKQFYDSLVPGGYLFVGHSETVERQAAPFLYVMPSVYRKPFKNEKKPQENQKHVGVVRRIASHLPHLKTAQAPAATVPKSGIRLIALGASTGGTEALAELVQGLRPPLPPIVIVQHIPGGFSRMFAERLDRDSLFRVTEAVHGDHLEPNHIYVAPGNVQMRVRRAADLMTLSCQGTERVSGHCPSVNVLFHSVAEAVGARAVGAILTGMGEDGAEGLLAMRKKGAPTLGQDEATSVVYGMPRAAYQIGAVMRQLPLQAMACSIMNIVQAKREK